MFSLTVTSCYTIEKRKKIERRFFVNVNKTNKQTKNHQGLHPTNMYCLFSLFLIAKQMCGRKSLRQIHCLLPVLGNCWALLQKTKQKNN